MAKDVMMPKMGSTMDEGTVVRWAKRPGEQVEEGELLLEVETDKAVVEVEATESGFLARILVGEGDTVPVGTPIAVLVETADQTGESPGPTTATPESPTRSSPSVEVDPSSDEQSTGAQADAAIVSDRRHNERLRASPAARRLARELAIDLRHVQSTNEGERITIEDVRAAAEHPAVTSSTRTRSIAQPAEQGAGLAAAWPQDVLQHDASDTVQNLSATRRVIARRMALSMRVAPQFALTRDVDMTKAKEFRNMLRRDFEQNRGLRLSLTDFLIQAVARTLKDFPVMNASYDGISGSVDSRLLLHDKVNIGLAIAVDTGLVVPVLKDVADSSLSELVERRQALTESAQAGRLTPNEMSGGTFTISNLGPMGVDSARAIINPPEAAILAIGRAAEKPVVRDGAVVPRLMMTMNLSVDHRVADGAIASQFLVRVSEMLEQEADWFIV